jgi:hypothetical protein
MAEQTQTLRDLPSEGDAAKIDTSRLPFQSPWGYANDELATRYSATDRFRIDSSTINPIHVLSGNLFLLTLAARDRLMGILDPQICL